MKPEKGGREGGSMPVAPPNARGSPPESPAGVKPQTLSPKAGPSNGRGPAPVWDPDSSLP